jgi:hypothetical protein
VQCPKSWPMIRLVKQEFFENFWSLVYSDTGVMIDLNYMTTNPKQYIEQLPCVPLCHLRRPTVPQLSPGQSSKLRMALRSLSSLRKWQTCSGRRTVLLAIFLQTVSSQVCVQVAQWWSKC